MPNTQPDAMLLALAAKHEELREPCPYLADMTLAHKKRGWAGSSKELHDLNGEHCVGCHGLGYVPKSRPALLAGLLEACLRRLYIVRISAGEAVIYKHGYMYGYSGTDDNYVVALALALARAEGLTGGA